MINNVCEDVYVPLSPSQAPVKALFDVQSNRNWLNDPKGNELAHDKTNKIACAPSEDSDQTAQSNQIFRCPHEERLGPKLPIARTAKTQIRLIFRCLREERLDPKHHENMPI